MIDDRLPLHPAARLFPTRRADYEVARAGIRLLYGRGVGERVTALRALGQALRRRVTE